MTRILVTGAAGFIARHVIPLLTEKGHEVLAPSHAEMDVLDQSSVTSVIRRYTPECVLHFAWIATPGVYQQSPENETWKDCSLHLFREAIKYGASRIVGAGTCFEYAWQSTPCIEDKTPIAPTTFYGKCKDACRRDLMTLAEERGVSAAWGRIFFLYGPGEPAQKLIASVILSLLKGEDALCTHGKQVRDFSYVKDIAGGFAALAESDISGAVNVASGEAIALKDLVLTVGKILDVEGLIKLGAREAPPSEPPVITADVHRLQSTGWMRRYTHEEGLRESIAWWREQ